MLHQLLGKVSAGSRFFASPQGSYNYSIASLGEFVGRQLGNFLTAEEIATLPPLFSSTIHLVMFPRAERDSILVHSLFGHEVGHLLADAYLDFESTQSTFAATLKNKVDACLALLPPPPGLQGVQALRHKTQVQKELRQVRKRAMEELISDFVGLLVFGPSALFASYEVFSLDDLDAAPRPNQYYPPSRYRLRFLSQIVKAEGYADELVNAVRTQNRSHRSATEAHLRSIHDMTVDQSDLSGLNSNPIIKIAYEWAAESLQEASSFVKQTLPPELVYTAQSVRNDVAELIERLMLGIPPSELARFPDSVSPAWQSTLLAGWVYRLEGKKYDSAGSEVACDDDDFLNVNTLCLRALESIFLRGEYDLHMASGEEM